MIIAKFGNLPLRRGEQLVTLGWREPAYPTGYGLVIHRSLSPGARQRAYYEVSCPITGMAIVRGLYPGHEGAIAALVQLVREFGGSAAFRAAIQQRRAHFADQLIARVQLTAIIANQGSSGRKNDNCQIREPAPAPPP